MLNTRYFTYPIYPTFNMFKMLSLGTKMNRRTLRRSILLSVSRLSTKPAPFSKRMSHREEEKLHNLYKKSSNAVERKIIFDNEDAIRDLIHVLRKYDEGSTKSLLHAIESVHNIAEDEACILQLTHLGVCSPLILTK